MSNNMISYYVSKLEKLFSKKIGAKNALATSSYIGAHHLALVSFNFPKNLFKSFLDKIYWSVLKA